MEQKSNIENPRLSQIYKDGERLLRHTYREGFIDGLDQNQKLINEQQDLINGLDLLLDWAIETGFGFDQIPEQYEKYKENIKDMSNKTALTFIGIQEAIKERNQLSGGEPLMEDHPEEQES